MFTFLYILLKRVILLKLLNDYLKNNYPEYYDYILYNVSYNAIFIFSKGQIIFNRSVKQIRNIINSNERIKTFFDKLNINKSYSKIEYIKNGEIMNNCCKHEFSENDSLLKEIDFIIFTDYENENCDTLNKKIIHPEKNIDFSYELSNIKFIFIELYIDDKTYTIDLKTNNYNYYLVDNIIDFHFIQYYFMNYYSLNISMDDFETKCRSGNCFIKIIDQNVNIVKIESVTESIQINKNDYTILQK